MKEAGTLDEKAFAALPEAQGEPIHLTVEQEDKAKTHLSANWAKAIS